MRFTIPQFIEYEPKILGPFTFKQFIYLGAAGAALFILYFAVSLFAFIISAVVLVVVAFSMAFLKVSGRPLPTVLMHFVKFTAAPKIYLWKRGQVKQIFQKTMKVETAKRGEAPKAQGTSELQKLSTKVETGIK